MKSKDEILAQAPLAPDLDVKLVYFCTECPWWTNRTAACVKPEGSGPIMCARCRTPLRFTELETYLDIHHKGLTDEARTKWLGCFDENWEEHHGRPQEP